ncbi:MAG TPA: glutamyl-tRNA amidotransferase, partial [Methylomirabilota bacterium]|nr:glutamyl-tRNA amidotransferase [Methylomirabilota bacterium]
LAVNGTLMRGLDLNGNLLAVGASFVREARTAPHYRLWSIGDRHPAMVRVANGGAAIALELWSIPAAGLASIIPILCEGQREITAHGGWRAYVASRVGTAG